MNQLLWKLLSQKRKTVLGLQLQTLREFTNYLLEPLLEKLSFEKNLVILMGDEHDQKSVKFFCFGI